eukprot:c15982_g1_i2.p1 GENE.c15982_g1_i2~~c15982_g1_i2.p1  ORF type:complete len:266 (+),score=61.67 c15982_g1_i2:288-1085(+)
MERVSSALGCLRLSPKTSSRISQSAQSHGLSLNELTVCQLLALFRLKSVSTDANKTIVEWANGSRHLCLMTYIPTPFQVLKMQCTGSRVVTALVSQAELASRRSGDKDGLAFLLHDLDHSDRFHSNPKCFLGQVGFLRLMMRTHRSRLLLEFLKADEQFMEDYNYCIADMNAYPTHMFQYLIAKLIVAQERALIQIDAKAMTARLLSQWEMPDDLKEIANKACSNDFNKSWDSPDVLLLYDFFCSCAGIDKDVHEMTEPLQPTKQ